MVTPTGRTFILQSGARSVALGGQRNEGEDRERCTTTVGNALEGQQNNKTTTLVDSQGWNKQSRGALSGHGTLNSAQTKETGSTCTLKLSLVAILLVYPMHTEEVYLLRAKTVAPATISI